MKVEHAGTVRYAELGPETQDDVAISVGLKTGEIRHESDDAGLEVVRDGLEESVLPLVLVDPKALIRNDPKRGISKVAARAYAKIMLDPAKAREFPPIVIDTDQKRGVLVEGGHRTLAATIAKIPEILAIDIAGARISEDGIGTYEFGRR